VMVVGVLRLRGGVGGEASAGGGTLLFLLF
jgi:hypothetical protein